MEVAETAKKVTKKSKEVERRGLKLSVTENGKEGKSNMIPSCGFLEDELRQYSKLEKRGKKLGVQEQARRKKCKLRFSIIKKNKAFPKSYMKVGFKKLLRAGMVPARTWRVHAVGTAPTERLKLRRQMAAAAGKKSAASLSLFMEAFGLAVDEDLSTLATQYWAEGVWTGKWYQEQQEGWMNQVLREVQTWRQVRGPPGAVMCETRDLGIKWPFWHTLIFEGDRSTDMKHVCPKDLQQARKVSWKSGQQSMSMNI